MHRHAIPPVPLIVALLAALLALALLAPRPIAGAAATPVAPPSASTPTPTPSGSVRVPIATLVYGGEVPATGVPGVPSFGLPRIDPKAWVVEAVTGVVQEVSDPLADAVKGALYRLLFTGGELTYDHPTVRELWEVSRRLANILLAVLALWSLADLALGQARGRTYHEALEFLGRVFLGLVFANFSAVGLAWLVRATDLVTAVFAGGEALTRLGPPGAVEEALATAIVWLIFWLVAALFFCQVLLRIALIDLCLVLAPVALVCWTQPRLQRVVRVWWTILAGLLAGQVVQVVALRLALSLAAAPTLGANPIISGMVLIALLFAGMKAPALIGGPRGGEASGLVTPLSFLAVRTSVHRAAAGIGALAGAMGGRSDGGGAAAAGSGNFGSGLGTPSATPPAMNTGTSAFGGPVGPGGQGWSASPPTNWQQPGGYPSRTRNASASAGTPFAWPVDDRRSLSPDSPTDPRAIPLPARTPPARPPQSPDERDDA